MIAGDGLDFESLDKYIEVDLSKTREEALYDMKWCVTNARSVVTEISSLISDFDIIKVPSAVHHTISCVNKCQSFRYLRLNSAYGETVQSTFTNFKANCSLYKILNDVSDGCH